MSDIRFLIKDIKYYTDLLNCCLQPHYPHGFHTVNNTPAAESLPAATKCVSVHLCLTC